MDTALQLKIESGHGKTFSANEVAERLGKSVLVKE